jgi:hypothetical protein
MISGDKANPRLRSLRKRPQKMCALNLLVIRRQALGVVGNAFNSQFTWSSTHDFCESGVSKIHAPCVRTHCFPVTFPIRTSPFRQLLVGFRPSKQVISSGSRSYPVRCRHTFVRSIGPPNLIHFFLRALESAFRFFGCGREFAVAFARIPENSASYFLDSASSCLRVIFPYLPGSQGASGLGFFFFAIVRRQSYQVSLTDNRALLQSGPPFPKIHPSTGAQP